MKAARRDELKALSEDLQSEIGEPLRSIRAEPALLAYTTESLEALRLYSQWH